MASFPFIGGAYTARSANFDAQRCVNLYPEVSESKASPSKSVAALYGTPGLTLWASLAGGPVRGLLRFSETMGVAVVGSDVHAVYPSGDSVVVGAVGSGSGPVSMASNGSVVAIADGASLWAVDPVAGSSLALGYAASAVDFLDGYLVFSVSDTGRFMISGQYAATVDPLDFATAEGYVDKLVTLIVNHREVWLFGASTTEVWFNSGASDFPLERIQGAFIEQGCAAARSVAKMDGAVFWLSADDRGQGIVLKASGYQPQRISTHAIEFAIGQYDRIDDAVAYTYQQEGHSFYVLSFPTGGATWVFDAATDLWHQRAWLDPSTGTLERHRAHCHMAFTGLNLVGDWEDGNVYRLDLDAYTDNGDAIARVRAASHIAADLRWQFFSALQIDMETGVGLEGGQGADPQVMLRWSDDGGHTWSNERWASAGRVGERRKRVRWRRLGKSRDRVFEVTITDPVKVALIGASVDVVAGSA